MWGSGVDERKLNNTSHSANQWHRGDPHSDAGRNHEPPHPTEEVEDGSRGQDGTWGESKSPPLHR